MSATLLYTMSFFHAEARSTPDPVLPPRFCALGCWVSYKSLSQANSLTRMQTLSPLVHYPIFAAGCV